jgi:hypothetical protein
MAGARNTRYALRDCAATTVAGKQQTPAPKNEGLMIEASTPSDPGLDVGFWYAKYHSGVYKLDPPRVYRPAGSTVREKGRANGWKQTAPGAPQVQGTSRSRWGACTSGSGQSTYARPVGTHVSSRWSASAHRPPRGQEAMQRRRRNGR